MRRHPEMGRVREVALLLCLVTSFCCDPSSASRTKRQIVFEDEDRRVPLTGRETNCVTPDRRPGRCVRLTACNALRRLNNVNRLRRFFCGFEGEEPKVCCPQPNEASGWGTTTTTRSPRRPPTTTRQTRRPGTTTRATRATRRPPVDLTTPSLDNRGMDFAKPAFLPRECGVTNFSTVRVVGGRDAEKGSSPWMALVLQEKRGIKSPDCGGALVTNRHVVTAAHCVVGRGVNTLDPRVLYVRLGEHDLRDSNDPNIVEVGVMSVKRHEAFDPRTYRNDIAVLKLERAVPFNSVISPICLPYDSIVGEDLTDSTVFVTGWGTTSFNGQSSPVLKVAGFDVQSQEMCRKAYERELPITDVYLCAGTADGSKDSCQGDSGGPLVKPGKGSNYYLVGIVSFGKLCAQPGYPGVYTRVTKFLDWLATNLRT